MQDHELRSLLRSLLLLVTLALPETWAGSHSMRYFHTAWTRPELGEPRFVSVVYLDDEELVRFDSDARNPKLEPRAAWMERVVQVDPGYWERNTGFLRSNARAFRVNLETLRGYYNQSQEDIHTLQLFHGCEVSPDGLLQRGFYQYAYDGVDCRASDLETSTWTAIAAQAEISKHKGKEIRQAERVKDYLEKTCVQWVPKYLEMGKEALNRTDPPSAQVTHHTVHNGEVTLRCRAQDFYPSNISLIWLRNGEEQLQDTEFIETRPGGDGTFQKWAAVGVTPGQEGRYTCRIQHEGLSEPLLLKWEPPSSSTWIIFVWTIVGVLLLLLIAVLAGVKMGWKNPCGQAWKGVTREQHYGDYCSGQYSFSLLKLPALPQEGGRSCVIVNSTRPKSHWSETQVRS